MNQRLVFSFVLFAVSTILLAQNTAGVGAKALAIHNSAIVIATHADTPQRFLESNFDMDSTDPNDIGQISLDKARAGNLGAEFFSIWVEPQTNQGHFAQHTFDLIDCVYQQAARHPDRMMMASALPTSNALTKNTSWRP
jgi:membrane dipeptidase